jgi:hypothetical protein
MLTPDIKRIRTALRQAERRERSTASPESPSVHAVEFRSFLVRQAENGRVVLDQMPIHDKQLLDLDSHDCANDYSGGDYYANECQDSSSESATEFSSDSEGECNAHLEHPIPVLITDQATSITPMTDSERYQNELLAHYQESARNRWHRKKSGQRDYWKANRRSMRWRSPCTNSRYAQHTTQFQNSQCYKYKVEKATCCCKVCGQSYGYCNLCFLHDHSDSTRRFHSRMDWSSTTQGICKLT